MEGIWPRIGKATGSVGSVALLFYTVINHVYSEKILALFGSEKLFVVTIVVIAALLIILLVTILKKKGKSETPIKSEGPKVTYSGKSTHNGDNNF